MNRIAFLKTLSFLPIAWHLNPPAVQIMTVRGLIPAKKLGLALIHEHVLVDLIGADKISDDRWERASVIKAVLPYLLEAKARGVQSLLDCTPAFLGRDPLLLQELSTQSGLHILTNTGYYGAVDNKYLPPWAFTESDEQLAKRWIREFEDGIDGTKIRPGFIKIGVNAGPLSPLHQKLVRAAGLTHLSTGLTICSHTGPALTAFDEIQILRQMGISPEAFVWVHAQNEPDKTRYEEAIRLGAWVSLDGMGWGSIEKYPEWLTNLKNKGALHKVLLSHDAGWYRPGEENPMGKFVGYTRFFEEVWPTLQNKGFDQKDHKLLLAENPAAAFGVHVRKI
jgi:phosphotriesterase-related protein